MSGLLRRAFLLAAFSVPISSTLQAEPVYKIGKEVEVPPEKLVALLPYFDLSQIRAARSLPSDVSKWTASQAVSVAKDLIHSERPMLKSDCPPEILSVFKNLNWSPDGDKLEFRDSDPYTDIETYAADTEKFLKLVGMWETETNPMGHLGETWFHIHVSVPGGRSQKALSERLNARALMRFIAAGKGSLALTDLFGYSWDTEKKGLVRLVEKDHIEIRNHFSSPKKDAAEAIRLLRAPEKEALRELSQEISSHLTEETLSLIATHKAGDLISILEAVSSDLPEKAEALSLDNPAVRSAVEKGVLSRESPFESGTGLLGKLRESGSKHTPSFAQKMRNRILVPSLNVAGLLGFADHVREIAAGLPETERARFLADPLLLQPLADPEKGSVEERRWKRRELIRIADLIPEAKRKLIPQLSNRDVLRTVVVEAPFGLLEDSEFAKALLPLVEDVPPTYYEHFLIRLLRDIESRKSPEAMKLIPFLKRASNEEDPRVSALINRLSALPSAGAQADCDGPLRSVLDGTKRGGPSR